MIAIVARSENGVIGLNGGLPWRCKGDLQFFKRTTMDRKIVVGRTTFEGLPPLKGREIFVLTLNPGARFDGAVGVSNPADVPADAIVCGGASIYDLMIPRCDQLLVTTIKKRLRAIPSSTPSGWTVLSWRKSSKRPRNIRLSPIEDQPDSRADRLL